MGIKNIKKSLYYDAFIYPGRTHALDAIPIGKIDEEGILETFPTGI